MKKKLNIVFENKELLIINKPSKMLTIATEKDKNHNLYQEASSYVKKKHPKNKVFIVNRLDRDTSGIVVFSKNEALKKKLQNHWDECAVVREYIAIVEGYLKEKKGIIKSYLMEDKTLKVFSTNDSKRGKLAITEYEVLQEKNTYSLVKIKIHTGRKNQIRVHLSDLGHPIIGDKKYGAKRNPLGRLGLHAKYLELKLVGAREVLKLDTVLPKEFKMMFDEE